MTSGPRWAGDAPARCIRVPQRPKLTHALQLPSTSSRTCGSTAVPSGVSAFQLMRSASKAGSGSAGLV